ncbi:uncharacterized protein LOC134288251 [Aedes albopictus]|uniref:Uncharacterized protein n=1 Tax=Aedes albopictus TaxID=7160 RepID=A0ABM1ZEH0_AEDAL
MSAIAYMSTDRYSTDHPIRTGSCVNNSRSAITRFDGNRNTHFAVNESNENKISARMALLLKHHEEQRALQRRVWEAERRALEQEKRLIREKYSLLKEQYSKRRGTGKRSQVATTAVEFRHNTSFDHNELPTDIRAAEAAVGSQRQTSIAASKQQANQSQTVPANHTIDSSHTDRIQQRNTSASPKPIPNDHRIINDSGVSHEDHPTRTKTTVVPSTPPVLRSPSSLKTRPTRLNSHIYDHHTTSILSASEENNCCLSIETETGCSTDGKLLQAPPNFVTPNLPDPAPPPLRLEEGLTLCRRNSDLDLYAKVLKFNGLLCDQLLLKERNAAYQCRRESDGECYVRDDDTVGGSFAASSRRKMKIAGLYHRCSNMQAGSHPRSINYSGDNFLRLLELSIDRLRHEPDQHKSICAVLNSSNVLRLRYTISSIRGKKGKFYFRCHIRRRQPNCSRKYRERNQVFSDVQVSAHISQKHTLEKKCESLGICIKHLNGEVRRGILGNTASSPGFKYKLVSASNKDNALFVFSSFCASSQSPILMQLISTFLGHLLVIGFGRMLPRPPNTWTFSKVPTAVVERRISNSNQTHLNSFTTLKSVWAAPSMNRTLKLLMLQGSFFLNGDQNGQNSFNYRLAEFRKVYLKGRSKRLRRIFEIDVSKQIENQLNGDRCYRRAVKKLGIHSFYRVDGSENEERGDDKQQQYQQRLFKSKHSNGCGSSTAISSHNYWRNNLNERFHSRVQYCATTMSGNMYVTVPVRLLYISKTGSTEVASVTGGRMLLPTLPGIMSQQPTELCQPGKMIAFRFIVIKRDISIESRKKCEYSVVYLVYPHN